jgi:hypothetical protein
MAPLALLPLTRSPCEFGQMACRTRKTGYGAARRLDAIMFLTRHLAAAIAILTACAAAPPLEAASADGPPRPDAPAVTCTNPFSGTSWQISIDYDRATVDANPAQVSDAVISWRDAKDGWSYTLDRRSGDLTITVASSTGGYFLHDHCRLPP